MNTISTFPKRPAPPIDDNVPRMAVPAQHALEERLRHQPDIRWPALLAEAHKAVAPTRSLPENDEGMVRGALSTPAVSAAMTGLVNARFFAGFSAVPDTTVGWVTSSRVDNFLPATALTLLEQARLVDAGSEPAPHATYGLLHENWAVARYSRQLILAESDLLQSPSVDLSLLAAHTLGQAAARLPIDLVYALLLSNPVMSYDGKQFFHADHGNYATAALDTTPLDTAMASLALQTAPDPEYEIPIPLAHKPRFLVVAPALYGGARRLARLMVLNDGNELVVRAEPRLAFGVIHPQTEEPIPGKAGAWLLASPSEIAPSVIVGGLTDPPQPQLRQFDLGGPGDYAGQWGIGWDVNFDVGAVLLDPRGIYFSDGA